MKPKETNYFVTIVTAELTGNDLEGYAVHREELSAIVASQPGFLRAEISCEGLKAISLTYWETEEAMTAWSMSAAHQEVKQKSHAGGWIKGVSIEVAQVTQAMQFPPKRG